MKTALPLALAVLFIALVVPAHGEKSAEEILKAVVKIRATVPKDAHTAATLGTEREGSGVVIDSKGHILTIGYLIVEAETIEVVGPEEKPVSAVFVGYDHATGFGLLRTEKPLGVEPMKFGQSSKLGEGDPVLVAGYGGKDEAAAARVISRKEFAGYWEYLLDDAIFTAPAYLNYGGAALIDPEGRLVGIGSLFTQMVFKGIGTVPCNMFVPIDLLSPILEDLVKRGRANRQPRPWLGVSAEETHGRVFVTQVTPGGPAEKAGLQPEDLVLTVAGKLVTGLADFYRKLWGLGNAGVEVPLGILRQAEIREIKVRSADRHQFLIPREKKI